MQKMLQLGWMVFCVDHVLSLCTWFSKRVRITSTLLYHSVLSRYTCVVKMEEDWLVIDPDSSVGRLITFSKTKAQKMMG
jgi:hypothetical protein